MQISSVVNTADLDLRIIKSCGGDNAWIFFLIHNNITKTKNSLHSKHQSSKETDQYFRQESLSDFFAGKKSIYYFTDEKSIYSCLFDLIFI